MKSRVLTMLDPRSVDLTGHLAPFTPDMDRLEREMRRAVNPFVRWESGATAGKGDILVCSLRSDCARFNRDRVKFALGSGMFNKRLEELADGMSVGETAEAELPEGRVALTVIEVTKRIAPELTDKLVARMGLEGVATVDGYRRHLLQAQREEQFNDALYDAVEYLTAAVISGSEFVVAREDWQHVVDLRMARSRVLAAKEGMVLEDMTPEQFNGRIPVRSYHELVALEQESAFRTLYLNLIGRYLAERSGFAPDREGYEKYIRDYMAAWGETEESARKIETYEAFDFFSYNGLANRTLEDVVRERYFKEE